MRCSAGDEPGGLLKPERHSPLEPQPSLPISWTHLRPGSICLPTAAAPAGRKVRGSPDGSSCAEHARNIAESREVPEPRARPCLRTACPGAASDSSASPAHAGCDAAPPPITYQS
jgi:hypothetical protein